MCSKGLPLPSGGPPNSISSAGAKLCTGAVSTLSSPPSLCLSCLLCLAAAGRLGAAQGHVCRYVYFSSLCVTDAFRLQAKPSLMDPHYPAFRPGGKAHTIIAGIRVAFFQECQK